MSCVPLACHLQSTVFPRQLATRRAWSDERDRVSRGEAGTVPWTHDQTVELITQGSVAQYTARYLHAPDTYPQLVDDPTNVKFVKVRQPAAHAIKIIMFVS